MKNFYENYFINFINLHFMHFYFIPSIFLFNINFLLKYIFFPNKFVIYLAVIIIRPFLFIKIVFFMLFIYF